MGQSNIIESREIVSPQSTSYKCIDELPSELISKTSSFLQHSDYFRFAKCNRKIYISCYSPPMIQKMDLTVSSSQTFPKLKNQNPFTNVQNLTIRNIQKSHVSI